MMVLTFSILFLVVVTLLSRMLLRDLVTPMAIYTLVWGGTILLLKLDLVEYHTIQNATWLAVLLSGTCFLVGTFAGVSWSLPFPAQRPKLGFDALSLRRVMPGLLVLGGIGLVLQLVHLERTVGLSTFLHEPPTARKLHTYLFVWGYLDLLNMVGFVVASLYFTLSRKKPLLPLCLMLVAFCSALFTTDRTRFFFTVIWAFFVWIYTKMGQKERQRIGLRAGLLTCGLLVFFVLFAAHYQRQYGPKYPEYLHFPEKVSYLADPYIYLTGSIPALQALMQDNITFTHGRFSLAPITNLVSRVVPSVEKVPLQGKLYFVPVELNTCSYLQQFYVDWGWPGLAFGPFVCGLVSGLLYGMMRRQSSFVRIYLAALAAWCCFISIFVNFFTQEATWFFVLIGWVLDKWVRLPVGEIPE